MYHPLVVYSNSQLIMRTAVGCDPVFHRRKIKERTESSLPVESLEIMFPLVSLLSMLTWDHLKKIKQRGMTWFREPLIKQQTCKSIKQQGFICHLMRLCPNLHCHLNKCLFSHSTHFLCFHRQGDLQCSGFQYAGSDLIISALYAFKHWSNKAGKSVNYQLTIDTYKKWWWFIYVQ